MKFDPKKENKKKLLEDEWVIQLIEAAQLAVNSYEKYLLDEIDYSDLAQIMTSLRDVLPSGCKNDDEDDN